MNIRDLEFTDDAESPAWFAIVDEGDFRCHLYIAAGEAGPDAHQYEMMDRFLERREALLAAARDQVAIANSRRRVRMDTFSLGAIFVYGSEDRYELDLAGSVKEKRLFGHADVPWNATVDTRTFELALNPQPSR